MAVSFPFSSPGTRGRSNSHLERVAPYYSVSKIVRRQYSVEGLILLFFANSFTPDLILFSSSADVFHRILFRLVAVSRLCIYHHGTAAVRTMCHGSRIQSLGLFKMFVNATSFFGQSIGCFSTLSIPFAHKWHGVVGYTQKFSSSQRQAIIIECPTLGGG